MAVLLKHLDLGHVAAHIVEYGLSESGRKLGLPRSIANVCKAVYEMKRNLIKVLCMFFMLYPLHCYYSELPFLVCVCVLSRRLQ